MTQRTDEELYAKYQASGCNICFAQLYSRWQRKLAAKVRKSYRFDYDTVADVCQEVWACLAKRGVMLQEGWVFSSWLFQAAKRKSLDLKRKQKCESEQTEQLRQFDVREESVPSVEERMISDEAADRLIDAISDLPPASAEAIRLTAFYGKSVVEVAYRFKVSKRQMERRLSLAKNFLKQALI